MRYAYYPGCSLHSTAKEYDVSLRAVCRKLGIELAEVKGWVCCGSSAAHVASRRLALALPLTNLAEVDRQGLKEVLVPCAACFGRFKLALHEVERHPGLRGELEDIVGSKLSGAVSVIHPLAVLADDRLSAQLACSVRKSLAGLRVVCYYGCLLTRPPEVTGFDDAEYPESMDRLLRALGATVLDWGYRTDCCGASFFLTRPDVALKLSHEILEGARAVGAEVIAVACPLCHLNLDGRQGEMAKEYGTRYDLPIYYFTELLAVALGVPGRELMLGSHFVDARRVLEKVGTL